MTYEYSYMNWCCCYCCCLLSVVCEYRLMLDRYLKKTIIEVVILQYLAQIRSLEVRRRSTDD